MKKTGCIYERRFRCKYSGGHDYKASGNRLGQIVFSDGRKFGTSDRNERDELAKYGIFITSDFKKDRYGGENSWTDLKVTNPDILPIEISWFYEDIYSASGFGTSGYRRNYITTVSLDQNNEVIVETKQIR